MRYYKGSLLANANCPTNLTAYFPEKFVGLCVTRSLDNKRRWAVTHIKTGLLCCKLAQFVNAKRAMYALEVIETFEDWPNLERISSEAKAECLRRTMMHLAALPKTDQTPVKAMRVIVRLTNGFEYEKELETHAPQNDQD